ncbi:hypothetical protein N5W20_04665 [Candidatus Kirkpatrickella diaphorinae]|uniref:Tetratricopeptide repeat protein n=1 Tax=Candidatus Kirkpatrickella diaphorinae TaxID=2984322 RepID=A0ABY6GLC9_9PROT|nr:tetratricopeptide repeat protein [Candidatus Kirkpatrickella diaphorinae]UYH52149.1 hypothetical protein N5W20_04665 [Candidatus Kirkpatrickella diaphorinae]
MRLASQKQNIADTGMALLASGDLKGATARFQNILAQMPDDHDAIHGMACVARAERRPDRAIALIGQVLKEELSDEKRALYHITLGHALYEAGHLEPARAAFSVATLLTPQDFRAHAGLGGVLIQQSRYEEGAESWNRAADLAAEPIPVWQEYAERLMSLRQFEAAAAPFRMIAETLAENGFAWANLGAALFEAGKMEAAQAALDKAVALGGDSAYTRVNRALTALALGYFDAAEADMARARNLAPDDRRIRNNAATLMQQMGQTREAAAIYAALMQGDDAEAPRAAYNLATLRLAEGRMRDGWRLFEARHAVLGQSSPLPPWDGRVGSDCVLIEAEQGAGDFIQFMRFLPAALARVPVILQADAALHPLIHLHPALDAHLKSGRLRWAGDATASCGMMSLPHLLQIAEPDDTPYLSANAIAAGRSFRVGICWRGSSRYRFDARRSIDPALLAPLFAIPNVNFVSLQKEHDDAVEGCHITQGQLQDWRATASEIQGCDLIISVDTSIAHLAGAMGRDVWLLNRFGGDWRWLGPRWYRNVTIFNAARAEPPCAAWKPVIDAACHDLRQRADQYR